MSGSHAALWLVEEVPEALVTVIIRQLRAVGYGSVPNPAYQLKVDEFLRRAAGTAGELAAMLEVAQEARRARPRADLVWTGPESAGVPVRQTEHVLVDLVDRTRFHLTMASFGIYEIPTLVKAIEAAISREVAVRILLGDRESQTDWMIDGQINQLGGVIRSKAALYRWPASRRLRDAGGKAGLLHAKFVVSDRNAVFLTSANFTEAAFERNMELGVVLRGGETAANIDRMVDGLIESGDLRNVWECGATA